MSSYPPPPPPQGPYGGYDKQAWKMQQNALKQQARMQRDQMRWQLRARRRTSLVGPLLLLVLGIVFLLAQLGTLSWSTVLEWYGSWWPLVLIGAGLLLLAEWFWDQQRHTADGQPPARFLGGGMIFLLIVLAVLGASSHSANHVLLWKDNNFGPGLPFMNLAMGSEHDVDDVLTGTIDPGGTLLIRAPYGDVTVTGASDDGQIHVSVHKNIRAHNDEEVESRRKRLQPYFTGSAGSVVLDAPAIESGHDDLTVQVPRNTVLTVNAEHGSINVQEIHAPVTVTSSGSGEVNLSGIGGTVAAHMNNNDASVSAHSISGGVSIEGHAGDISLSDISGPVNVQGEFFGTTSVARTANAVSFHTKRTQFDAARIDGDLTIESGSDLEASSVMGPVTLNTAYRNITLNRVQGSVKVTNRDGSVTLTNAPPSGAIDITNSHGAVDVGLPDKAGFVLSAQVRHGDIENDFGLSAQENHDDNVLTGTVAGGGPTVRIQTTDGDITIRKSAVEPLPPAPPAPPKITIEPPAPPASPAQTSTRGRKSARAKTSALPAAPAKPAEANKSDSF